MTLEEHSYIIASRLKALEECDTPEFELVSVRAELKATKELAREEAKTKSSFEDLTRRYVEQHKRYVELYRESKGKRKVMTLAEFNEDSHAEDGLYALWTSEEFLNGNELVTGFRHCVSSFLSSVGFTQYPDWADEVDEKRIKIILLELI